ncbi:MAG TPA: hypothetical protein VGD80_26075 [Kofleriaceae bacterium]
MFESDPLDASGVDFSTSPQANQAKNSAQTIQAIRKLGTGSSCHASAEQEWLRGRLQVKSPGCRILRLL